MILITRHFFHSRYVGLTLWPFIFLKERALKLDQALVNHERIHLKQQQELLVLPFYGWYLLEWLIRMLYKGNRYKAYRSISFEREAYANEDNPHYLKERKPWRFLRYL